MKIKVWISTRNCLQFDTTTVILHKSKKYHGVKVKENYFEMSIPSYWMYCTMWFTSRSTNYITSNLIGLNMDLTCLKA